MRVCGRFPNSPARATTVLGLEHFRATADGGVWALSFVPLCACAGAFQTPLRARDNCIGVGALSRHRRLALSFVTALLARPWKVGVPCQDHLRECSRRAA